MKSNLKIKTIILIAIGIFFAFSTLSNDNLDFNTGNSDENVDKEKIQISAVSGRILIDGNSGWTAFRAAGNCTGNGTISEPYVIEDLVIDGGGSGSGILINNSNVYFRIENSTVYNSGNNSDDAGITLYNTTNGQLIDNNCSSNHKGVSLSYSYNNTVSGNIANYNTIVGITLSRCNNNTISENTANNNSYGYHDDNSAYSGIFLYRCNNNTVFGNTANNNSYGYSILDSGIILSQSNDNTIIGNTANYNSLGINLWDSDYNTVSGNILIGNEICIVESDCQGNRFSDNGLCTYGQDSGEQPIPGYDLFLLLGILSVAAVIITKKVKKS